jgi:hypothetical protein
MKSSVLWDLTLCSPLKFNQHFGGICCFHFQGLRISSACYLLHDCFLPGLFYDPEDGGNIFLRNVYTELYPRRMELYKFKSSNCRHVTPCNQYEKRIKQRVYEKLTEA